MFIGSNYLSNFSSLIPTPRNASTITGDQRIQGERYNASHICPPGIEKLKNILEEKQNNGR
jgi:hypothetical protein